MNTKLLSSLLNKVLTAMVLSALIITALPILPAYAAAIVVNSNADTVAVNGLCTLREAITNANDDAATNTDCAAGAGNDSISFSASMTIVLASTLPAITDVDGLTINGGGNVTINGNGVTRIAIVNAGAPATFQSITLINGYVNGDGGGIYNSGNLTVNNVTFNDNRTITTTTTNGGAIYHTTGTLSIASSTFISNRALQNGGAIYISNGSGTMSITNSTFQTQNSISIDNGGAIYLNSGALLITETTFTSNAANINGGAIYVNNGTLTLDADTFTSNIGDNGGAIFYNAPTLLTVTASTFNGNQAIVAAADGGAIDLFNALSSGSISGSTFTNNTSADDGGAISNAGMPFTITTSTFQGNAINSAAGTSALGGAIRNEASADQTKITLSSFINNTVTQSTTTDALGGAIHNDGTSFVLANVTFSGNSVSQTNAAGAANANGGAIYSTASATFHNVTFSGNRATEVGSGTASGGNLYRSAGTVTLANTIVRGGLANGAANNCGGTITNGGNNIDFNGSNNCGVGFSNADPQLGALTGSPAYFTLNTGSPAIDGGNNAICANAGTTNNQSQNGVTRPQDGNSDGTAICDIGSYEALDTVKPNVTINQASGQSDPTSVSPINFTVVFSEPVTGFATGDVTLSGTAGATTAVVTAIAPNDGTTYNVAVSGMTGDGTVIATISANVATDPASNGNNASTSTDNTVTYSTTAPDTIINSTPSNPSSSTNATFTFSSPDSDVVGFECRLDGGAFTACTSPMNYTSLSFGSHTFDVRAVDNTNNVDPTPASFTWVISLGYPVVTSSTPADGATVTTALTQIQVSFSEDVKNDSSLGAANNTANYLLVEDGDNNVFNTLSCLGGVVADDTSIAINSATYTNGGGSGPFVATLAINGGTALPAGTYRLFVCGTTSIEDLANNKLNNGQADTQINFVVQVPGTRTSKTALPKTGFAQGMQTVLPAQPKNKAYASTELWLEIPKLSVKMSIVGVPSTQDGWDVSWLGKNAGWLNGSAYPTWNGNSVLTGHVWDALNQPGPFAKLKELKYGDQIKIHAFGQVFIYEVRESRTVSPTNTAKVFKHEEKTWITLVTCEDYKELSRTYSYRRMVRAVLISVTAEK